MKMNGTGADLMKRKTAPVILLANFTFKQL